MLRVYCADLFSQDNLDFIDTDAWLLVVDYRDSVAEFIRADKLKVIWQEHSGWFGRRRVIEMNSVGESHQKIFNGVFGENYYESYNGIGRQYFLSGGDKLMDISKRLSFYLDGFKFICVDGFVKRYAKNYIDRAFVVLCFDDTEKFIGMTVCGRKGSWNLYTKLRATVCDERLQLLIPKWAIFYSGLYEQSFLRQLVKAD